MRHSHLSVAALSSSASSSTVSVASNEAASSASTEARSAHSPTTITSPSFLRPPNSSFTLSSTLKKAAKQFDLGEIYSTLSLSSHL